MENSIQNTYLTKKFFQTFSSQVYRPAPKFVYPSYIQLVPVTPQKPVMPNPDRLVGKAVGMLKLESPRPVDSEPSPKPDEESDVATATDVWEPDTAATVEPVEAEVPPTTDLMKDAAVSTSAPYPRCPIVLADVQPPEPAQVPVP